MNFDQLLAYLQQYWESLMTGVNRLPGLQGPVVREGDEVDMVPGMARIGPAHQFNQQNPGWYNEQIWDIPAWYNDQGQRQIFNTLDMMPEYETENFDWQYKRPQNPRQM